MDGLLKAITLAQGQSALASKLENLYRRTGRVDKCSPQKVNQWVKRGNVPAEYCPDIEHALDGAVRCEEIRPDVDWSYLRQSCKCEQAAA